MLLREYCASSGKSNFTILTNARICLYQDIHCFSPIEGSRDGHFEQRPRMSTRSRGSRSLSPIEEWRDGHLQQ